MQLIWRLDRLERYDEALELAYEGLEANSNFANFYRYIYMTHWNAGEVGKALRWAEAAQTVAPWDPFANLYVCQLYFRMQDYEQTELCFEGLRPHGKFFYQHYVALLRQRGEIDEIPGILAWHAKQPIGSQGRFKLFTNDRYRIEEAYHWMQIGDWDRAFDIMRTYGPYLFDEDGQFTGNVDLDAPLDKGFDRYMALYAAIVLQKQGHADRADAILEAILEWVDANGPFPRDPFDPGQFWGGPMNAIQIHAIRGDREAVLQVLKDGIDEGYLGWFGQDGPVFNFIRDDPEWKKQMNRLGENTERQWQIYRELKNEPLF
jgi:tetratricopeptide (TPR) repeat protein